jgi:hypothetical protein
MGRRGAAIAALSILAVPGGHLRPVCAAGRHRAAALELRSGGNPNRAPK